jgi:bacillithiol biosynthesis cysteine-adding enzyme BshC
MDCWVSRMAIPYTLVPKSTPLYLDYLYNFERVADFFTSSPFRLASYKALRDRLPFDGDKRHELATILERQNRSFGASPRVFENLERLRQNGTCAVVTGQQVGLFSGPAFTLYKALTAVRLAQWLSENGLPTVPIFWLATEDHDLEEVAKTTVFDSEYGFVPLSDPGERTAARPPVGWIKLTPAITDTLNQLESALPIGAARDDLMRDLRDAYQPGVTWSQSFGRLMARLFGRWGVILVDSLDPDLHRLSAAVYASAIDHAAPIRQRLQDRSQELEKKGYHAQVNIAGDSTLLFSMRDGDRLPIHQNGTTILVGSDTETSVADLKSQLAQDPLQFSANVLLRPVVQDALLPTLAYVAGPSELAYLAQAQVIYEMLGRPMPVVVPRAGFTLVDARTERLLEKYQLTLEDVWKGEENLGRRIAAAGFSEGWSERFDQAERELAGLLAKLQKDIESLDPTLLDTLGNTEEKMKYQMERLRGKLTRAALQRSDLLTKHQQSLVQFLYPANDLQERQIGGVYFLARAGYDLLDRILNEIQIQSCDHQIVHY